MPTHLSAPTRARRARAAAALAVSAALILTGCSATAASDDEADGTWTYESDFGPVEIPDDPERVVSVDFYTPAALMDLGVTPVGVVNSYFTDTTGEGIPVRYTEQIAASDATSIGEYYEVNLESILEADPDLVLATDDFLPLDSPMREKIEQIAPILTFKARDGESWRTRSTELATIFDREDALQPLVDAYDTRRDEIKQTYSDILDAYTFAVFGAEPDTWGTYADTHFSTPILRDLGARFREQQDDEITEGGFPEWFSYEELERLADADIILNRDGVDSERQPELDANGLWTNLPAVQQGMVFGYISKSPTGSYGWAMENLEDLEAILAEVQTTIDAQA